MTPFIAYIAKVIICSGIFYGYYHIALRNNRFHQWNRYYLLLCAALSLIVPMIRIPLSFTPEESAQSIYVYPITLREQVFTAKVEQDVLQINWMAWIYGGVIVLCLLRLAFSYWKILRIIYRSKVEFIKPYRFVFSEHISAPFSFFRYIFLHQQMNADTPKGRQMLQHEMVHVQEKHSLDKLLMECITALCWINPFFHLMKRELALVHEFIADKKAVKEGDVADYAETILQMALQTNHTLSMTNNFLQHPIKRRIFMLTQSRKLRFSYLRRLMILPIAASIFCSLAFVVQQEEKKGKTAQIAPPPPPTPGKITRDTIPGERIFTFVEKPPTFPGGDEQLAKYLGRSIRYPKPAVVAEKTGTIFVSFVVTDEGEVKDVHTLGAAKGYGLEEEAIRVVKLMPKWNPGKQNGQNVNVQFNLPIRFTLGSEEPKGKKEVYAAVDVAPAFPGGQNALVQFLAKNYHIPADAKVKLAGDIMVSFIVDENGNITDVKKVNRVQDPVGIDFQPYSDEAIRVVKTMPKWTPAKKNGKNVAMQLALPIRVH